MFHSKHVETEMLSIYLAPSVSDVRWLLFLCDCRKTLVLTHRTLMRYVSIAFLSSESVSE